MPEKVNLQRCTICGNFKEEEDQTWFLMTESCWEDKLNVWKWNQAMAAREAVHSLCSPRHVRELIIHWMTTGCLHYPFAQARPTLTSFGLNRASAAKGIRTRRHRTGRAKLRSIATLSPASWLRTRSL